MLDLAVTRRQGDFSLDLAFTVPAAQVTALFGRSGAGKSSVVRMIAGLDRPDSGHITLDGLPLTGIPTHKRRIGLVFQDSRLLPHYGVRGNLLYGFHRVPEAERFVQFEEVVDLLGLRPLLDRRPGSLSGGEKQRVAIGRALLASPRLLLMDEPLASLDGARKAELLDYLARLAGRYRLPILYVSHAPDEILRLASRMVLIEGGRALAEGEVEEVMSRPDFAAASGSRTLISILNAVLEGHDPSRRTSRLSFGASHIDVPRLELAVGSKVRARIAADHVILAAGPVEGLSVRNQIPGQIVSLRPAGSLVDVTVDIGCPLHAELTMEACGDLGLEPGRAVTVLIKAAAISSVEARPGPQAYPRPDPAPQA